MTNYILFYISFFSDKNNSFFCKNVITIPDFIESHFGSSDSSRFPAGELSVLVGDGDMISSAAVVFCSHSEVLSMTVLKLRIEMDFHCHIEEYIYEIHI